MTGTVGVVCQLCQTLEIVGNAYVCAHWRGDCQAVIHIGRGQLPVALRDMDAGALRQSETQNIPVVPDTASSAHCRARTFSPHTRAAFAAHIRLAFSMAEFVTLRRATSPACSAAAASPAANSAQMTTR